MKKAVILAGGLGTRLKPFTEIIPKPLLPIGEKSVLEIQIERLKKYNFDEVIFAEPFLVMNGDILSLVDFQKLYEFAINKDTILTISIKKEILPFAFGNIFFEGDYVTGIQEKPDIVTYILAGIYIMKPEIFDYIPNNELFGMDQLIQKLLKLRIPIAKYELKEYWLDIGRIDDYEKAQEFYNKHIKEK
jgi:NDP-sugar pyrophosphorylase family protein